MTRTEQFIQCPHCLVFIPVTGKGSKTIVRGMKPAAKKPPPDPALPPKIGLKDILGEHFDPYWAVAKLFGNKKNFSPIVSATAYMVHINAGATDDQILRVAETYRRFTEPQYLKQLVNWLNGQDFTVTIPESTATRGADATAQFNDRRTAE